MHTPDVENILTADLTDADRERLGELRSAVYPPEAMAKFHRPVSGPAPECAWAAARRERTFLVREGGRILSVARFLPRRVETGRGPLDVLALAGVMTHPAERGRGLGRAVVRAAFAYVDDGTFPVSLFQTDVPDFYARLGAREVRNRFVNRLGQGPTERPWWSRVTMIYPAAYPWDEGEVDLVGPAW